jgi:RNA polymerase sigma-70 factor (ECF subfamily)
MEDLKALSDEALVPIILETPNAFGVIIERYEEKLSRYIDRLGVHVYDDRLDVLQEIFIKSYKNLNSFDGSFKFSSWIYRIAHNEAISWYRKRSVRPEGHLVNDGEEMMLLVKDNNPGAEKLFDDQVGAAELMRALDEIDLKYKEVLILRFFEHKEYEEISDIIRVPIGSVGTLIARGKKQLANEINKAKVRI